MKRSFLYIAMLIFSGGLLGAGLTGCGDSLFEGLADDDTRAAKIERAQIAMDEGNYAEAVNLLKPFLDKDGDGDVADDVAGFSPEEVQMAVDLAEAYLGKAGVDLLAFLNSAAELHAQVTLKQRMYAEVRRGIDFWITPVYAATVDCLNDPNFIVISNALPTLGSGEDHNTQLIDLQLGLNLLAALQAAGLDIPEDILDNMDLLSAAGHITRVVLEILSVTDLNGNNFPDAGQEANITPAIASEVNSSLTEAHDAIVASGIAGEDGEDNDLTQVIDDLKADIDGSDGSVEDGTISETELEDYLSDLLAQCTET